MRKIIITALGVAVLGVCAAVISVAAFPDPDLAAADMAWDEYTRRVKAYE